MKKVVISLFVLFIGLMANAALRPDKVSDIPQGMIGVYQLNNDIEVYSKPDKKSDMIFQKKWNYSTVSSQDWTDNFFAIMNEKKECSYLYARDLDEDFVEVLYNKQKGLYGWVYKSDSFQFLPWITFYNLYGRKYGLKFLKEAPQSVYVLYSRPNKDSQLLARLNRPIEIRLTNIQGNWALVTVLDIESVKTGYVQWRGEKGELYLFPLGL